MLVPGVGPWELAFAFIGLVVTLSAITLVVGAAVAVVRALLPPGERHQGVRQIFGKVDPVIDSPVIEARNRRRVTMNRRDRRTVTADQD